MGPARGLTFGAHLTSQWLPAKRLHLATSTYRGYERNIQNHILPVLGKIGIRRLGFKQIEALYDSLLRPKKGKGGLAPQRPCTRSISSSGGLSPTPTAEAS